MAFIINLNKRTVNIESIWIHVQCPSCGNSFNIRLKKPQFNKNCGHCGNAGFDITVSSMKGSVIAVTVLAQIGFFNPVEVTPDGYEIDEG